MGPNKKRNVTIQTLERAQQFVRLNPINNLLIDEGSTVDVLDVAKLIQQTTGRVKIYGDKE